MRAVSIHAPREGCDRRYLSRVLGDRVSIHAPREGCDEIQHNTRDAKDQFQFTHPGRGATKMYSSKIETSWFQFTHPGRGATHCESYLTRLTNSFNSRTPGGVRREGARPIRLDTRRFNSRTPGGVRRRRRIVLLGRPAVSIHAPREGCDGYRCLCMPRVSEFQFTHPGRGATDVHRPLRDKSVVSIHAPREGCDGRLPCNG